MEEIIIKDEYIKLGQALKLSNAVGSGVDAKYVINEGLVKVNGEICCQRGRKLIKGDIIWFDNNEYVIGGI